jgi:hypothetical protein
LKADTIGIFVFAVLCLVVVAGLVCLQLKARKLAGTNWESLVEQIQPVPFASIETVALDHLNPNGQQLHLAPDEMWKLVGGFAGLQRMRHNAKLIIQLAAYVQRWNFDESVIVAERIRHDAVLLERALFRIELQLFFSFYRLRVPFYVHQAAASYYLMTRRLLALYETNQYILYPRLAEAI